MKKLIVSVLLLFSTLSNAEEPNNTSWTVIKDKNELTDETMVRAVTLDTKTGDLIVLMCIKDSVRLVITNGAYSVEDDSYWARIRVDSNEPFESFAKGASHERYHALLAGGIIRLEFMKGESAIIQTTGWKNESVISRMSLKNYDESYIQVSGSCEETLTDE